VIDHKRAMRLPDRAFWEELRQWESEVYVLFLSWGVFDASQCEADLSRLNFHFIDKLVQNFKRKDQDSLIPGTVIQVFFFFGINFFRIICVTGSFAISPSRS